MMEGLKAKNLQHISGVQHAFMTRVGGVSIGYCQSADFALKHDELENILENKRRLLEYFQEAFSHVFLLSQKHTNRLAFVDENWEKKAQDPKNVEMDGFVTRRKGVLVGVLTADCVPLLMSTRKGDLVAAVHVGWKGALDSIVESAINMMRSYEPSDEIVAALGPCLQQHNFEVSPDFVIMFQEKFMCAKGFFLRRGEKHFFSLQGFIRYQLEEFGIHNITVAIEDTYSDSERFFSYRRATHKGEAGHGCQVSVIGIKN